MIDFDNPLDQESLDDAYKATREVLGEDITRPRQFIIGRLNDDGGVSTTVKQGEYGRIWVRQPGEDTGDAVQAINTILQPHEITFNNPVMMIGSGSTLEVDKRAPQSADYNAQLPTAPQKPINRSQYRLALIHPTQPESSFYVNYTAGIFQLNNTAYQVTDRNSNDFAGTVPGSGTLSIKVEVDPRTQIWYETTGTNFTQPSLRAAFKNGDLDTTRANGRFLLGWVRLYDGQETIEVEDILPGEHMLDLIDGHSALGTLVWTDSGHTGDPDTSAGFDSSGDAKYWDELTGNNRWPNGFEKAVNAAPPTDSVIAYNSGTRTITIDPTGDSFNYWLQGIRYPITTTQTKTHPATTGNYFFYWDSDNVLQFSTTPWSIVDDVPISFVYYSTTQADGLAFEERHGVTRNPNWHYSDHYKRGTFWEESGGLGIDDYTLSPGTPVDADNQWSIDSGHIHDEDIAFQVTGQTTGSSSGIYQVWYRSGASGEWLWEANNVPLLSGGSYLYYNQFTGGVWARTALSNNRYVNYYTITTSALDSDFDIFVIMSQNNYSTLAGASAEIFSDLDLGTFPFQEALSIYKVTFRTSAAYGSEGKCRIEAVADTRQSSGGQEISTTPATSHPALSGLTWDASGHLGTADKLAGFDSLGVAVYYDQPTSGGPTEPSNPQGRLSLTSANPNDDSDVTSSTLYYVQYPGNTIMVYNLVDTAWEELTFDNEPLSLAGTTPNTLYDFYGYDSTGFTLDATTWGINTEYNISAVTAADPCVITYLHTSQIFTIGDNICIQAITGNINTAIHVVTSVTAVAVVSAGVSYSVTIEIDTTGLTYTSGGTVRLLKETRATAIGLQDGIPVKGGAFERRYLGTGLIGGDGGEMTLSTNRVHLANYYNREHRKVRSSLDVAQGFAFVGTTTYILPPTPNICNDGQGRVALVSPYNGTDIHMIWGSGMFASVAGLSTMMTLEQNNIQDFNRPPASDNAFGQTGSIYAAGFASLFANSANEGYNYIQHMVSGSGGGNHTIWVGDTLLSGKFQFGLRGYVNA